MALSDVPGDADQPVLLLVPRHGDAIIDLKARLIAIEQAGAVLLLEDDGAAEIGGVGLAIALVADDQKRRAVGEEFAAIAVRPQLDVAALATAIALRPRAGRALDVGGIAERREQGTVDVRRLVPGLREGRAGGPPRASRIAAPIAFKGDLPSLPPHAENAAVSAGRQCAKVTPMRRASVVPGSNVKQSATLVPP
ncbi:hypothetical protein [Bradyrhizobium sp. BWA-3-5]|uniref:hypothetical protein n=1 Tax=Bradyrhizobium sp. BWA-3-5 TaxID=3080013 RepID=UPI00293ED3B1|nr:hypothetical protein [Bradyrhizobium sp. BWA-3-5]WOH67405.1 hypothetical protein RX331_06540 [Bradyrhizobium sp. BWA-3-5]